MGNIYTVGGGTALFKQSYVALCHFIYIEGTNSSIIFLKVHKGISSVSYCMCSRSRCQRFVFLRVVVFLAFFCRNSSQILLLCLRIVVFLPVGMGVFHHWSSFQNHFGCV